MTGEQLDLFQHLSSAFKPGTLVTNRHQAFTSTGYYNRRCTYRLEPEDVGTLHLPTGWLVAADPISMIDIREPYRTRLPAGRWPMQIAVGDPMSAEWDDDGETREKLKQDREAATKLGSKRAAFARIRFSDAPITSWTLAEPIETRKRELRIDHRTGFGVDIGTGCFLDAGGREAWDTYAQRLRKLDDIHIFYKLMEQRDSGRELAFIEDLDGGHQIALFQPGIGIGVFECFIGRDRNDEICEFLCDFNLATDSPHYERADRTWWRRLRDWWLRRRAGS